MFRDTELQVRAQLVTMNFLPVTFSVLEITCTAPDALANANHFFNNSTYGAEVIYNCSTGYNFTGDSNVATCSTSGRWEGLDGQCNREWVVIKYEQRYEEIPVFSNDTCLGEGGFV